MEEEREIDLSEESEVEKAPAKKKQTKDDKKNDDGFDEADEGIDSDADDIMPDMGNRLNLGGNNVQA